MEHAHCWAHVRNVPRVGQVEWDKGHALAHLLGALGLDGADDVLPIYIGDDRCGIRLVSACGMAAVPGRLHARARPPSPRHWRVQGSGFVALRQRGLVSCRLHRAELEM